MIRARELHNEVVNIQNEKYKDAEHKIDNVLRAHYNGEHADVPWPEDLTRPQLDLLKSEYIKHGWAIKEHSDQRDGSFWRFSLQKITGNMNER